ncbi:MAG TPA: L-glutamate gamma-semialdehyde dehydrogenase [Polyangiaceae bacterium]|nr:L-glutamate gamma-semialdehyde dehydrogenase [Polyangiaceae bacterium]
MSRVPEPVNEPVLGYAPGSAERAALERELERWVGRTEDVPLYIGGEALRTREVREIRCPHELARVLGWHALAGELEVERAVMAACEARQSWARTDFSTRAAVFLRAAELVSGRYRQRLNAVTLLNQSKTAQQAEIDAACELSDFLRFNVFFAEQLADYQPKSARGEWNSFELRPLDGFVYAVSPFNFTAIAGNLPSAPALMGNTVVWKPSPHAVLSAHAVLEVLIEAGLPPGVINLVLGDAATITRQVLAHPSFAGLHYTGSSAVLQQLWLQIAQNLPALASFPRIVAETGGKDFIVAHASADLDALAVAIVRGAYEYQGQKCSAASRIYVARSLWGRLEERVRGFVAELRVGDPADFRNFMGAVIGAEAYARITGYQKLGAEDPSCRAVVPVRSSDEQGYFVWPTLFEVQDPRHRLMSEEIFGPVASLWVYDDDRYEQALELCDTTSPYALTGAVFARDRSAIEQARRELTHAAGNFYINDKPTGAVVGQQPFGGSRWSGTNDKAGAPYNLLRWTSPRTIKENFDPPRDYRYPYMSGE